MNIIRTLEIDEAGNLYSVMEYEDEYHIELIQGITEIKEILFFEE